MDLYRSEGGEYYYNNGWNSKGILILLSTIVAVSLGKFIPSLSKVYESSYLIGAISTAVFYLMADRNTASPKTAE